MNRFIIRLKSLILFVLLFVILNPVFTFADNLGPTMLGSTVEYGAGMYWEPTITTNCSGCTITKVEVWTNSKTEEIPIPITDVTNATEVYLHADGSIKIIEGNENNETSKTICFIYIGNGSFGVRSYDSEGYSSERVMKNYSWIERDFNLAKFDVTQNTTDWTNDKVTLNINISDTDTSYGSYAGFNQVIIYGPSDRGARDRLYYEEFSDYISSYSFDFDVTRKGEYTITTVERNRISEYRINISNIDKNPPTCRYRIGPSKWTNRDVNIIISADDLSTALYGRSGINKVILPDGNSILNPNETMPYYYKVTYKVSTNGIYNFIVIDKAGNSTIVSVEISNIDKMHPSYTASLSTKDWINSDVTISLNASDTDSGISQITLPNGIIVKEDFVSYTVGENDSYTFIIQDQAGNQEIATIIVSNIDKSPPINNHIKIEYP